MMARHTKVDPGTKLNRLWQSDLDAFARFLGIEELPGRSLASELRALKELEDLANADVHFSEHANMARWRVAEELLWLAATTEEWDRRREAQRSGKLRIVQRPSAVGWRNRLFAVLEHPSLREAMGTILHDIVVDLFRAQEAFGAEVERLREAPDTGRLRSLIAQDGSRLPPPSVAEPLERLRLFVEETERRGNSKAQQLRGRKQRKGIVEGLSPEQQDAKMQALRKRYPTDRPRAVKEFAEIGYSPKHAREVATRIGWPGRPAKRRTAG